MAKKRIDGEKRNKQLVSAVEFFALEQGREDIYVEDIRKASEKLGVSEQIVKSALKSQGVEWKAEKGSVANVTKSNVLPVVAAILRGATLEEAAKAGGVTKQWASNIRQSMIEHEMFEAAEMYAIRTLALGENRSE